MLFRITDGYTDLFLSPPDTYCSQVGIGLLRVQTVVVLDILEGLVHQASIAALVAFRSGTFHQVLLAQRHQLAGFPELLALQSSSGAESPARATLTLQREKGEGHIRTGPDRPPRLQFSF